jgi:hypothetical protein
MSALILPRESRNLAWATSNPAAEGSRGSKPRPFGVLELGKYGWRNDHSLEQPREYRIDTAQDEIVQRRGIRDDDAHERGRIFSSVAASVSRSETE